MALVYRETARDILAYFIEHEPIPPSLVADELNITRSTVKWHLDHSVEQDMVMKQCDTQNRVTLMLVRPKTMGRLLKEITPSLPEQLVDWFIRLVDQLFEDGYLSRVVPEFPSYPTD